MEELKAILETVAALGGGAKSMFIWWLVLDKLIPAVLIFVGFSGTLTALYVGFSRATNPAEFGNRCARAAGEKNVDDLTKHQMRKILEAIEKWTASRGY